MTETGHSKATIASEAWDKFMGWDELIEELYDTELFKEITEDENVIKLIHSVYERGWLNGRRFERKEEKRNP